MTIQTGMIAERQAGPDAFAVKVDAEGKPPHISVVVPVFRSEGCLLELTRRLHQSLLALTANYEIVYVEDGGDDRSWELICTLAKEDRRVRGVQFCRNFGQHFALTAGLDQARGDWIVTMDSDLQDPPEHIGALYEKAQQGFDVVLARRIAHSRETQQPLSSKLFYQVFDYLTGTKTDPLVGAFRIFSRRVRDAFVLMREQSRFFGGLMQWLGFSTTTVDVPRGERFAGESTYNLRRKLKLASAAILAFSNKPLALVINFGFLMSFMSIMVAIYFVYLKLMYGYAVEGWTSVIVSLYFLTGIIMITLGVVGIYVGKVFDQTKGRPLYIIRRTTFSG